MKEASVQDIRQAIIETAVEAWRFRGVFEKAMSKLDAGESRRYLAQFQWFIKSVDQALETAGLKIVNVEGELYDIGMAVTPLNINDFEEDDNLFIEQMIEPIIMGENAVVKTGTVILGRRR